MTEICIKNITKFINKTKILDDISLSLKSGRIYGLRGKNGSGKTMLMRAISGLLVPSEGDVIINGEVLHKDIEFPKSIGALIENPAFLNHYTGFDNLNILGKIQGNISRKDIETAMLRVGLNPDDKRVYRKYSLGMKQKLGIANAIMGEPDIIILDEPINALDEDSVRLVKDVLIELRDKDKLIIIACHDKEELDYLSDEIWLMRDGKMIGREEAGDEAFKNCKI